MLNKTLKFEDIITFTRASAATYWDANGVLQTAATDEPRFDHDPVTGERLGLLREEQRTNLAPYSEDFTQWATNHLNLIAGESDPAGGTAAFSQGIFNDFPYIRRSFNLNEGVVYFSSVMLKEDTAWVVRMAVEGLASCSFDLRALEATPIQGAAIVESDVVELSDGFRLCYFSFTVPASGSYGIRTITGAPGDVGGWQNNEVNESVIIYGADVGEGARPDSYIRTTGATATRAADVDSVGYGAWHKTSGTYLVEFQAYSADTVLADGDLDIDATATTIQKIAVSFDGSSSLKSIDGATAVAGPGVTTGSELELMPAASGHIRSVSFYPEILDASDLEALTA